MHFDQLQKIPFVSFISLTFAIPVIKKPRRCTYEHAENYKILNALKAKKATLQIAAYFWSDRKDWKGRSECSFWFTLRIDIRLLNYITDTLFHLSCDYRSGTFQVSWRKILQYDFSYRRNFLKIRTNFPTSI